MELVHKSGSGGELLFSVAHEKYLSKGSHFCS